MRLSVCVCPILILLGARLDYSVPDYRSPINTKLKTGPGIWSLQSAGVDDAGSLAKSERSIGDTPPTFAHYAIAALHARGFVKHVVTQNIDGLHQYITCYPDARRLPAYLCSVWFAPATHVVASPAGPGYREPHCRSCMGTSMWSDATAVALTHTAMCRSTTPSLRRSLRLALIKHPVSVPAVRAVRTPHECRPTIADCFRSPACPHCCTLYASFCHCNSGGRLCDVCGDAAGPMADTIVHFGESLHPPVFDKAMKEAAAAQLCIVLGVYS